MKKTLNTILLAGIGAIACACHTDVKVADYEKLSENAQVIAQQGDPFRLRRKIAIVFPSENVQLRQEAASLSEYLQRKLRLRGDLQNGNLARRGIVLDIDTLLPLPESCKISISAKQIRICGKTEEDVLQGIRMLRQTLPTVNSRRVIFFPAAEITAE